MDDKCFFPITTSAHQEAPFKLFIFPYAGGNPVEFSVPAITSLKADVVVLNYPGRGRRRDEKDVADVRVLVQEVAAAMRNIEVPYAFLGYSMGGLVAYEVAKELRKEGKKGPEVLFVVADEAPQTQKAFIPTNTTDEEFLADLKKLDLLPSEILANPDMVQVLLPSIKADMDIENSYFFGDLDPKISVLSCPIVGICGSEDKWVTEAHMKQWAKLSSDSYTYYDVPKAPHIFLTNAKHAALLRSVVLKHCTAPYLPLIKNFPKGPTEPEQIDRVESTAPVKLVGNTWIKWDGALDRPLQKPAALNSAKAPGLGAYYSDVKKMLIVRGYEGLLKEVWG